MLRNQCFWNMVLQKFLRVPWTARRSNQSILKEISPGGSLKDWCWSWNSNTLATWCEELTHLKRPWCWERLRTGGEGGNRRWDSWLASLTQWTWVWASSGSWWWTSNHLILCRPLLLLPSVFPSIRVFSNESVLHIRWPKDWSFSFSISSSNEYSGLISFRMAWLELLAVQGTLKSLLQHHS